MAIYAIADLHLSTTAEKPMDIFGPEWSLHSRHISSEWLQKVRGEDTVLIPGDISWAMNLDEAVADLNLIAQLPGTKILIRGNHDYWWHSIGKVRSRLDSSVLALQNDAVVREGVAIAGTRGWLLPTHPKFSAEDEKIYKREAGRLRLSLAQAAATQLAILVMMHYPPCGNLADDTLYTQLLEEYHVNVCVYGHLHGNAHRYRVEGMKNGVRYQLVSADYVRFSPVPIEVSP